MANKVTMQHKLAEFLSVGNTSLPLESVTFIHSIVMCRMWRFHAVLRSFFHSSLLCTFSCHPSPPTILLSFLPSSCHLFLGLPLNPVVPKFIYNTLLGILFSSILCTCPNHHNLFNLIVSIVVGFLTLAWLSLLVNILQFSFSLSYTRPKILLYTFLSKMFNCFLSLFVSVPVSDAYVNVLSIVVFFSLDFSFFDLSHSWYLICYGSFWISMGQAFVSIRHSQVASMQHVWSTEISILQFILSKRGMWFSMNQHLF